MALPIRIVDLHAHLFNARYIPLASVIANAMGKDESNLANHVARLLEFLTGSSYEEAGGLRLLSSAMSDEDRLERIWNIAKHELLVATGSLDIMRKGSGALDEKFIDAADFDVLRNSKLMSIIADLSEVDYEAEGWKDKLPFAEAGVRSRANLDKSLVFGDLLGWARGVVKNALGVVTKLMDSKAWGAAENYLEFFLTMLKSEEKMLEKLVAGYGNDLPPLQISHYMMDMQMAYEKQKPPYYPFHPVQVDRMQLLQRANPARLFGFSAFDPRRTDWRTEAEDSMARGFLGFKFYPAMGYRPSGNDSTIQVTIDSFFAFCEERDAAIFAHCTPQGFQTRHKEGANAHPKYWREVLKAKPTLRLGIGHAGGGYAENGSLKSHGWMAKSDGEWDHPDNFAKIVVELCVTYPNVYCEMGCITELFEEANLKVFISNIKRAQKMKGSYNFMDKVAYGSDWHMPDMVDNTRKYLNVFVDIMDRSEYQQYREKFFWENAYNFLKLPR
ncbi:MAG: Amidohydro-rel domain-containing protein [Nitrospira sp.]|nr:MAG: Amidohydro-rel domain-containing protein [Nitrospira sp.]